MFDLSVNRHVAPDCLLFGFRPASVRSTSASLNLAFPDTIVVVRADIAGRHRNANLSRSTGSVGTPHLRRPRRHSTQRFQICRPYSRGVRTDAATSLADSKLTTPFQATGTRQPARHGRRSTSRRTGRGRNGRARRPHSRAETSARFYRSASLHCG